MQNATFPPDMPSGIPSGAPQFVRKPAHGFSWTLSLTGICFLLGVMMAVQVRAVQQARTNRVQKDKVAEMNARLLAKMQEQSRLDREAKQKVEKQLHALQLKLKSGYVSKSVALQLNAQVQDLRDIAGLTAVSGPGISIILRDNPQAGQDSVDGFLPGMVHDFDLQQMVQELLSAKAEAITINDVRITGYTPMRCVGPTIYVNFEPCAAPFRIKAIGKPETLEGALNIPQGIVENLKRQSIGVRITRAKNLKLAAAEGKSVFHTAKRIAEKPATH